MTRYERDLRGYGPTPPHADWPGGAAVAVQFVLNYEEGGERCLLHGDAESEAFLSDIPGAAPWPNARHWNMEQHYDYGARAGFWRLHRLFVDRGVPLTVFGVATALARSPEQVAAMRAADWEIASHGLKWIDYRDTPEADEAREMDEAIALHTAVVGAPPTGWYTGRCSMNTVALAAQRGFAWLSDSYADDLPYWIDAGGRDQLVIPYTLDANDMRFAAAEGFDTGAQFFSYLQDAFDTLLAEGRAGAPKMMSVGLHCRLAGRPGRAAALARFIDYVRGHDDAWIAPRGEIAAHWARTHPPRRPTLKPSAMTADAFVAAFGGVFEHSPWVAERAFALELGPAHESADGLHNALARAFRSAGEDERLGVLRAHPDLAGKLAAATRLTAESAGEQASAGLDALTDAERARFGELNAAYTARFGFPFILAVKGKTKAEILDAFERRLTHDRAVEFAEACAQVERIALLRLRDLDLL